MTNLPFFFILIHIYYSFLSNTASNNLCDLYLCAFYHPSLPTLSAVHFGLHILFLSNKIIIYLLAPKYSYLCS